MDRIDIYVQMSEDFEMEDGLSSTKMFEDVLNAFTFQKKRGQSELNAKLSERELQDIINLDDTSKEILFKATTNYGLSHRSVNKIQSIARTIADIDQSDLIHKEHILEALSYRRR